MFSKFLVAGLLATSVRAVENPGDDPLQWLRDSIPGEPGVDYPIFSSVQETSFSCEGRVFGGYYADVDMGCQAYHVCLLDPLAGSMYPTSFLCPNGTLFQQQIFNCDWWYNVDCASSESYYGLAEGAFASAGGNNGNGNGGGQCPNVNPLSDAECGGTASNCWSPGQSDTDCPNFGLCCFDGCANTCVDGPTSQSDSRPDAQTQRPAPRPTPRPTQPAPRPTQPAPTRPVPTRPAPTRPAPTRPVPTRPAPIQTTTGYDYPVPENPLLISRPANNPAPTPPATLYGAPVRSGRQGRRGRRGRRLRLKKRKIARSDLDDFLKIALVQEDNQNDAVIAL